MGCNIPIPSHSHQFVPIPMGIPWEWESHFHAHLYTELSVSLWLIGWTVMSIKVSLSPRDSWNHEEDMVMGWC